VFSLLNSEDIDNVLCIISEIAKWDKLSTNMLVEKKLASDFSTYGRDDHRVITAFRGTAALVRRSSWFSMSSSLSSCSQTSRVAGQYGWRVLEQESEYIATGISDYNYLLALEPASPAEIKAQHRRRRMDQKLHVTRGLLLASNATGILFLAVSSYSIGLHRPSTSSLSSSSSSKHFSMIVLQVNHMHAFIGLNMKMFTL